MKILVDVPFWLPGVGIALMLIGAIGLLRALFLDYWRRRWAGRPALCPRCRYDMRGNADLRCPECGYQARSPKALTRARVAWWSLAVSLIVIAIGYVLLDAKRIANADYYRYIPDRLLVRLVRDPNIGSPAGKAPFTLEQRLVAELWSRYSKGRLSLEDRKFVAARQFAIEPPFKIRTRTRWPADSPIYYLTECGGAGVMSRALNVTPIRPAGEPKTHSPFGYFHADGDSAWWQFDGRSENPTLLQLPIEPGHPAELSFDVRVTEGEEIWHERVSQEFQIGGTIDEVMRPIRDEHMTAQLRAALRERLVISIDRQWLMLELFNLSDYADVAIGLRFSLEFDGVPIASAVITFRGAPGAHGSSFFRDSDSPEHWRLLAGDIERLAAADFSDPRWNLRVTGDGHAALMNFDAKEYWAGTLDIPCGELRTAAVAAPQPPY